LQLPPGKDQQAAKYECHKLLTRTCDNMILFSVLLTCSKDEMRCEIPEFGEMLIKPGHQEIGDELAPLVPWDISAETKVLYGVFGVLSRHSLANPMQLLQDGCVVVPAIPPPPSPPPRALSTSLPFTVPDHIKLDERNH
jgi:hypothetical protein